MTFLFLSLYVCMQYYWYRVTVSLPDQDGRFMYYFVQIKDGTQFNIEFSFQ